MKELTNEELRLLAELLPGIATQLRDAAAGMRTAVKRLAPVERQEADPEAERNAAIFMHGYCRLLRVIGNLTEAETLVKDTPPALRSVDVVGLCRAVCEEAEAMFAMKRLALVFESDKPGLVTALDEARFRRLLMNLLSNALKFTPEGGSVTVRVRDAGRFVNVSVADTGCGIAPDRLETVFDRFLHAQPLDPAPKGIGLGLTLCRRIAQAHGGRIMVESAEGAGATFTVSLPKTPVTGARLSAPPVPYAGGLNPTLVELSDGLPTKAFTYLYLD